MFTTVTTRQYLDSVFEKNDKHLTRFRTDERSVTTLIQSLSNSQRPIETLKKLKSLVLDLCKKYAPNYTVGITACKSYYENHGKLTNNPKGKFVNHNKPKVWNVTFEPEWREACRNMINVLLEKNNNQLPPLIFTLTSLKNLISCYMLCDNNGKLVENYQSAFSIIDETLNAPIPESMSSQFIQNKIDSSKPVNLLQPTDRSELLKLHQNAATIGEWVHNVMDHYQCGERAVYKWFEKFDIQPKAEMKKPFEDKDAIIEDLQKKVEELQKRLDAANTENFTLQGYKTECETLRKKCDDIKNDACEKIRAYNTNVENFKAELQHKFDEGMEKLKDAQSQTPTTNEEMVPKSAYDEVLKMNQELENKLQEKEQQSPVDGDMVSRAEYDKMVKERDYYIEENKKLLNTNKALNEQHNKDIKEISDLNTTLSNKPIDMPTTDTNNMQLGPEMMKPTFNTEVNFLQGLEGWTKPTITIG